MREHDLAHAAHQAASGDATTLSVPTGPIACDGCAAIIEERLRRNPAVKGVHVDARRQVAHVQVRDGAAVTAAELAELVAGAYGERNPVPLSRPQVSSHAHSARPEDAPVASATQARARRAQLRPLVCPESPSPTRCTGHPRWPAAGLTTPTGRGRPRRRPHPRAAGARCG